MMIRGFQLLAAAFLLAAGYFYLQNNRDGIFLCLVLSACSMFLSIRFQAKGRLENRPRLPGDERINK